MTDALKEYDAFIAGQPCDMDVARRVCVAACFAAAAYEHGLHPEESTHAMTRAFLLALQNPLHRDLDYLRASSPSLQDRANA